MHRQGTFHEVKKTSRKEPVQPITAEIHLGMLTRRILLNKYQPFEIINLLVRSFV